MAYLLVFDDTGEVKEVELPGKRLIIGRDPECSDYVLADPAVSRMHAMIFLNDGEYSLKDMDSAGGTFLNRRRIRSAVLKNGDSIQISSVVLEFKQPKDDRPNEESTHDTVSGIARRFRILPSGMGLNCRVVQIPPIYVFNPGDTIMIGEGGILINSPQSNQLDDVILELELLWPDGRKKTFLGEIIQYFKGRLCVKLHSVTHTDYERMLGNAKRSAWTQLVTLP